MEIIRLIDFKNYDENQAVEERHAVRAVIVKDSKLALVYNESDDAYQFPGGGIKAGETKIMALKREVLEEAGLTIKESSVKEIGIIKEIKQSKKFINKTFHQYSYIYYADVFDEVLPQKLDERELIMNLKLVYIDPKEALKQNLKYDLMWLERENKLLEYLINEKGM